jgi:hypothetical protein
MTNKIIVNGGDPINDCPTDWDAAKAWEGKANENADHGDPMWRWDCGFKLDYDGGLIQVSSRFYPPKSHYGPKWDGDCTIRCSDKEVGKKHFECDTLEQLRTEVEAYVKTFEDKILKAFT